MILGADDIGSLVDLVARGGLLAFLIVSLYGGFKKDPWWVFGWVYREKVEESEFYKNMALKGVNIAEVIVKKEGE